jgi:hypothetical protein
MPILRGRLSGSVSEYFPSRTCGKSKLPGWSEQQPLKDMGPARLQCKSNDFAAPLCKAGTALL